MRAGCARKTIWSELEPHSISMSSGENGSIMKPMIQTAMPIS